jgi:hypothetical protein
VAWTVHLHHESHLLAFVLDIIEVPEVSSSGCSMYDNISHPLVVQSHTGEALAQAFHNMLVKHKLTNKVSKVDINMSISV